MGLETAIAALAAVLVAGVLTGVVRSAALASGVLDIPNQRSSHKFATPRGGGLAIVAAVGLVLAALHLWRGLPIAELMILAPALAVAAIGFVDDRRALRPSIRLAIHFGAALAALAALGGLPPLRIGAAEVEFGVVGYALGTVGIVWTVNLFNFMDGIDGIAASEAAFIGIGGGGLLLLGGGSPALAMIAFVFAASACGFLAWNWPPARIFMGDVGSGFLGFFIAALALCAARTDPSALFVWLILGGVFFVDATTTFLRRLFRREAVWEAHRSHAYQWLSRRWDSHRRVTIAVLVVNLFWLLPGAFLATLYPRWSGWLALGTLLPLLALALAAGAGRPERTVAP